MGGSQDLYDHCEKQELSANLGQVQTSGLVVLEHLKSPCRLLRLYMSYIYARFLKIGIGKKKKRILCIEYMLQEYITTVTIYQVPTTCQL